jgi:hypothetical protein
MLVKQPGLLEKGNLTIVYYNLKLKGCYQNLSLSCHYRVEFGPFAASATDFYASTL